MRPTWRGNREELLGQVIRLVERFIQSDRISVHPTGYNNDELRRRLILTLSMNQVVQHIWEAIRFENTESLAPIFDNERPIRSTADITKTIIIVMM